jgi:hypothetical protein
VKLDLNNKEYTFSTNGNVIGVHKVNAARLPSDYPPGFNFRVNEKISKEHKELFGDNDEMREFIQNKVRNRI